LGLTADHPAAMIRATEELLAPRRTIQGRFLPGVRAKV
jgi:hypothetical protein